MKINTHYDTLKVTPDAPEEVITAAYKALARIYHPDKNGSSPEAMAKMQALNIAYGVLSDTHKRAEHDLWIRRQEQAGNTSASQAPQASGSAKERADKASAEAAKWTAWAEATSREAKEAQKRLDKALADLAKSRAEDRAKWEAWVTKMEQEAKEARDKADKAAQQSAKVVAEAMAEMNRAHAQGK